MLIPALLSLCAFAIADRPITITFLHNNDLHSHLEPTTISRQPYGGYARIATLLKKFRARDPNPLFFNAGDIFQGTLYFNVYDGMADLAALNALKPDAVALGNHEFDRGIPTIARFSEGASFPLLCANMDFSREPKLRDLVKPSVVLKVGGEELGVVGAITPDLMSISSPGDTVSLKPLAASVQAEVDNLLQRGINKIVLVTHIGYQQDLALASELRGVDVIIGGHSHTPIGTPTLPGWPTNNFAYPTTVKDQQGRQVYVVQAWEWGKVFGRMKVDFDDKGEIVRVYDAAAIPVDSSEPEDPAVKSIVDALKLPILELQNKPVGESTTEINKEPNATGEQLMGNVIADSMLAETRKLGAVAAFTNSGGVRANIDAGPITYGEAIAVVPFNNSLVTLELTGQEIFDSIQFGIGKGGKLLPSRGTSYEAEGGKLTKVMLAGQPLDLSKSYLVTLNSFIAGGGDGHEILKNAKGKRTDTGFLDIDALISYLKANSPIAPKPENRVVLR
jgi:5'-nucleotidase